MNIDQIIKEAIKEDVGPGDYSSLSTIPVGSYNKAKLVIKEAGILSGVSIAQKVFNYVDSKIIFTKFIEDGSEVEPGEIVFTVEGPAISILTAERLALNFMQRMSGIATSTNRLLDILRGTRSKILDTRKTTPLLRELEKMAVRHGGGYNHRFGLYDMIMIKDNHIDFAGGIDKAIDSCNRFLKDNNLNLKIEIEVRNFVELQQVINIGNVDRIMLDNFTPEDLSKALKIIDNRFETEASGGITEHSIRSFAETGVDYISVGALTHQIKSIDMSLVSN